MHIIQTIRAEAVALACIGTSVCLLCVLYPWAGGVGGLAWQADFVMTAVAATTFAEAFGETEEDHAHYCRVAPMPRKR